MKPIAALYSFALGVVALWAWGAHLIFGGSASEHLLPAILLNVLTLPSSLLIEKIAEQATWILNSPTALLSMATGLGLLQAIAIWLFAMRSTAPGVR